MKPLLIRFPKLINLWPPLLGAGIKLVRFDRAARVIEVEMPLTRRNTNYVGVHFGGSLFAMTDPFYMLLLGEALGREYIVWDKAASIRFRRPGTGTVRARFELTDARLEEIRTTVDRNGVCEPVFTVDITDGTGAVVATAERIVYCAGKAAHKARLAARSR